MFDPSNVLARLGWDHDFASSFAVYAAIGCLPGRVATASGRRVTVITESGAQPAVLSGRVVADPPEGGITAGDWVALDGEVAVAVMPRRSVLLRHATGDATAAQAVAANVDLVLVTTPLGDGVRLRRLERYLALAWSSGATPVVLLTKADLSDEIDADVDAARTVSGGAQVLAVSADGMGLVGLRELLSAGRTAAVVGPSGAGKSTLINRLAGKEALATADVRGDGRGRHTTTHRELISIHSGGVLIDTPGMRQLGVWDTDAGIEEVFGDISELAAGCRFRDCRHESEPGCAVHAAATDDPALLDRLASRNKLEREQRRLDRMRDGKAIADARREIRRFSREVRRQTRR